MVMRVRMCAMVVFHLAGAKRNEKWARKKKDKKERPQDRHSILLLTSGAGGIKSADSKRDTSKMIIPIRCFTCGKVRACSLAAHPAR